MAGIKGGWCGWPNRKYMRNVDDLFLTGARVDAWRAFWNSKAMSALNRVKGSVIWFNRYEYFDKMIAEFDCAEEKLRSVIRRLMRPGHAVTFEFLRNDIYDARAWAYLPLDAFVPAKQFKARSGKSSGWQDEVLQKNEMPMVQFGIRKPWSVSRNCFTLRHRIKHDYRVAEMTFAHPQLDERFQNRRWVADGTFPIEQTREEMHRVLMESVVRDCLSHQVTIVD